MPTLCHVLSGRRNGLTILIFLWFRHVFLRWTGSLSTGLIRKESPMLGWKEAEKCKRHVNKVIKTHVFLSPRTVWIRISQQKNKGSHIWNYKLYSSHILHSFFFPRFWATLMACGHSWARDRTHATAMKHQIPSPPSHRRTPSSHILKSQRKEIKLFLIYFNQMCLEY